MKAALASEGVSLTPRREKLLQILAANDRHPSVSEIHEEVKHFFPQTSLATVYNTIELLKDTGQVLEIEFSGTANRYDGRRLQSHTHLICLECSKIEDMVYAEAQQSIDTISTITGYSLVRQRTDYYGTCPDCQTNQNRFDNYVHKADTI